jgi:peptidoglycan/LPS O-acetylase OafA/YrhL
LPANRIPELDGLRGIAILLVICCHYELLSRLFWRLPSFGWIGVDIFFVLSGFLITSVLLNLKSRQDPFKAFYGRRARRILPAYFLFLLLLYSISALLGESTGLNSRSLFGKLFFLQAFGYLPQMVTSLLHGVPQYSRLPAIGPGISGAIYNSTTVLWSLSIEEYFYLLWAPAVLWLNRKSLNFLALGICAGSMGLRRFGFIGLATYVSGYHRFDALIYGALTSLLLTSNLPIKGIRAGLAAAAMISTAALAAVLVSLWPFGGLEIRSSRMFEVFGLTAISVSVASFLGLIVIASGHRWLAPLRFQPLRFTGQISYMLYLMHLFVYLVVLHFFRLSWLSTILAFAVSIFFCWLSWTYLEEPILNPSARRQRALYAKSAGE